jgi:small subunit ribosomal protein S1
VHVRILEVDAERRRLSLSLKRVEDGMPVQPKPGEEGERPALGLSDEVFADEVPAAEALEAPAEEPVAEEAPVADEEPVTEAEPEAAAEEPVAEAEAEPEAEADASDEAEPTE